MKDFRSIALLSALLAHGALQPHPVIAAQADSKARLTAAEIQRLLDAGGRVRIPAGTYALEAPLLIGSNTLLEGDGNATVLVGRFDGPVIASRNYFTPDAAHAPRGYTRIRDLRIVGSGDPRHGGNHGILLRDFFSEIRDVTIEDVGGSGVVMTHHRLEGDPGSGTFVENRLEHVVVRGSHRTSFLLGEPGRPRFTDGYLYACVSHAKHPLDTHLQVGSGGGWRVSDFHGYGRATVNDGAVIYGGFRTKLRGVHLQNFRQRGLALLSSQESIFITDLSLDSDANADGAIGLFIGRNAEYQPAVHLAGFSVTKDHGEGKLLALVAARGVTLEMPSPVVLQGRQSRYVDAAPQGNP
jgi:hypothetical protein